MGAKLFAVLVSEFELKIHLQYTLSSALSKIFSFLKGSDRIDDIVRTMADICESSF